MADIRIDVGELTALAHQLGSIRRELDGAEQFSHHVADLTGDDRLGHVIRDFADKWNLRRGFFIDDLEQLQRAAEAIRDTFVELDERIAAGLSHGKGGGGI
jgi:hypothetical protein